MRTILKARADQHETAMRAAFASAIAATPEHTKLSGRVYRALTTTAGLKKGHA